MSVMHNFNYESTLAMSQRVNWKVEDIIGPDKPLDFTRPFMPETFVRANELPFLTPMEKLRLNQIRGHDYLYLFGFVEEFILPFVMDHVRPELGADDARTRAMLQFAGEEAKHIDLFRRFRRAFTEGFGTECGVIGPAEEVAKAILAHDTLGVALAILHIEWMTQRHYVESVRDTQALDPQFCSLLRHHWMEECQHAKLDTLMVEEIAAGRDAAGIQAGVEAYLSIGGLLDGGLKAQVELDLASLAHATGRMFSPDEAKMFMETQHQAMRWTFLGSGMTHRNFLGTVGQLSPAARVQLEGVAKVFC